MNCFHDCPKCGKPNSAYGDMFCGACEGEYQHQLYEQKEQEIRQLQDEIKQCCGGCEEYCQKCNSRYAQILDLQGREWEAIAWMNR